MFFVKCDWCGGHLYKADKATLKVTIDRQAGSELERRWAAEVRPTLHFCVEERTDFNRMGLEDSQQDDGDSCFTRALAAICGTELDEPDLGMEWRLVPVGTPDEPQPEGAKHARSGYRAPSAELRAILDTLVPKCQYALPRAGIATVEQVEAMTDEELLSLPEVGHYTVRKLREAIAQKRSDPKPAEGQA